MFLAAFKKKKKMKGKGQEKGETKNKPNNEKMKEVEDDEHVVKESLKNEQVEQAARRSVLRVDSYDQVYDSASWKPQDLVSLSDDFKVQLKAALQTGTTNNTDDIKTFRQVPRLRYARSTEDLLETTTKEKLQLLPKRSNSFPETERPGKESARKLNGSDPENERKPVIDNENCPEASRNDVSPKQRLSPKQRHSPKKRTGRKQRRSSAPAIINEQWQRKAAFPNAQSLEMAQTTPQELPGHKDTCDGDSQMSTLPEYIVIESYKGENDEDNILDLQLGDRVRVAEKNKNGWWFVAFEDHQGWFPSNYLFPIPRPRQMTSLPRSRSSSSPLLLDRPRSFCLTADYYDICRGETVEVLAVDSKGNALIRAPERVIAVPLGRTKLVTVQE